MVRRSSMFPAGLRLRTLGLSKRQPGPSGSVGTAVSQHGCGLKQNHAAQWVRGRRLRRRIADHAVVVCRRFRLHLQQTRTINDYLRPLIPKLLLT